MVALTGMQRQLIRALESDALLAARVERLASIPGVGRVVALTWALEMGDISRFGSVKKAVSYCGLCGAEKSSGGKTERTPISKQRNKHLQTILVEAAKLAPRWNTELALVYERDLPGLAVWGLGKGRQTSRGLRVWVSRLAGKSKLNLR